MTTYNVTAWCDVPHYTTFDVEADSIDEALEKGKLQARDESGEPCNSTRFDWDEFEITSEADENASLTYLAPTRLIENAGPTLLAALCGFEEAWRTWADDIRRIPELAASTEMFDIYEQARAAIAEATQHQGRAP
jgi:hypothetical protein